jgi:transcriptional regulator with XRE-family HTH domain
MTNKELGHHIGVSPSMASRIRNGERLPSIKVLIPLADCLGVSIERLILAHTQGPEFFGQTVRYAIEKRGYNG